MLQLKRKFLILLLPIFLSGCSIPTIGAGASIVGATASVISAKNSIDRRETIIAYTAECAWLGHEKQPLNLSHKLKLLITNNLMLPDNTEDTNLRNDIEQMVFINDGWTTYCKKKVKKSDSSDATPDKND